MRGINKVALGISLAALSLTAGNAMAQAEETPADTLIAVLRTAHDTVNNIAHHDGSTHPIITIEHHDTDHKDSTKHAPLPPREILDFLTQSLNLAGRDILTGATKHTSANHTGTDSDDTTGISENEYRTIIGSTVAGALAGTPIGAVAAGLPGAFVGGTVGSVAGHLGGRLAGNIIGTVAGAISEVLLTMPFYVLFGAARRAPLGILPGIVINPIHKCLKSSALAVIPTLMVTTPAALIRGTIAVLPSLTIGSILGIMGGHLTAMAVGAILGGSATRLCVPLGGPILHTMAFLFGAAAGALLARLGLSGIIAGHAGLLLLCLPLAGTRTLFKAAIAATIAGLPTFIVLKTGIFFLLSLRNAGRFAIILATFGGILGMLHCAITSFLLGGLLIGRLIVATILGLVGPIVGTALGIPFGAAAGIPGALTCALLGAALGAGISLAIVTLLHKKDITVKGFGKDDTAKKMTNPLDKIRTRSNYALAA